MRLADAVAKAAKDCTAPAAALALVYAERIDESGHASLALSAALDQLRLAAQLADESSTADKIDDANMKAFRKVAAALSAVTVASDLGPKLLAALAELLLTPRALAGVSKQIAAPAAPADPLKQLRDRYDNRHLRSVS